MLALFVLCVLIFTSFFREGDGGFLHRIKGTVAAVATPVKDVAAGAVQPLEDGWGWFADLRGARDRAAALQAENEELRSRLVAQDLNEDLVADFRTALKIADDGVGGYRPVTAQALSRPLDLSHRVEIDKGRSSGIVRNSLVFAPYQGDVQVWGALIGLVTDVNDSSAVVTFITDPTTVIGAKIAGADKPLGLLTATASGELSLTDVPGDIRVDVGDDVVTGGYGTRDLPSPYPRGLPIGKVSNVGSREPGETQTVQVTPLRDPLELDVFTVFVPDSPEAKRRAAGIGG